MVNKHPENMGLKVWSSRIFLLVLYHHNSSFHRYDCLLHQVESVNPHNWRLSPYHMRSGQNPHAAMVDIQRRIAHTAIYIYIYINIYIYITKRERETLHWDAQLPAEIQPTFQGTQQQWQKLLARSRGAVARSIVAKNPPKDGGSMGNILHKWHFQGEHPLVWWAFI